MEVIEGILFDWCETGTEGTIPAIQDVKYIDPETGMWSYDGLIALKDYHHIVVLDKESNVILNTRVSLWDNGFGYRRKQLGFEWKDWVSLLRQHHKCILINTRRNSIEY